MDYQRLRYLTSVEIEGEVFDIFLDQNFRFVAIFHKETPELSDGIANVVWGNYSTFDSYEGLTETLSQRIKHSKDEDYDVPDPEERYWDNVATFNERFAGDY